jgi:1,4-dihydroxy-2-naphthoyl-CoA synthase
MASKTAISDHHEDAKEGVKAFHEKREASFNKWLIKKDRTSVS